LGGGRLAGARSNASRLAERGAEVLEEYRDVFRPGGP
jgi:hypothetical protein